MWPNQGYDFRVDDYLEAVRVKHAADVRIELVKLVNGAAAVCVPQHAVAQDEVVRGVERCLVVAVVVGAVGVVQREELAPRRHIVNLRERERVYRVERHLVVAESAHRY